MGARSLWEAPVQALGVEPAGLNLMRYHLYRNAGRLHAILADLGLGGAGGDASDLAVPKAKMKMRSKVNQQEFFKVSHYRMLGS